MRSDYRTKKNNSTAGQAQEAARVLKKISKINVFENTRRQEVVEVRSLLVKILRDVELMTYYDIRDFFKANGKDYDHTTAMHAYKNYELYIQYNKNLESYFAKIVPVVQSHNAKRYLAKLIIDKSSIGVAEVFTYMNR